LPRKTPQKRIVGISGNTPPTTVSALPPAVTVSQAPGDPSDDEELIIPYTPAVRKVFDPDDDMPRRKMGAMNHEPR
jgi:hypothetical protein